MNDTQQLLAERLWALLHAQYGMCKQTPNSTNARGRDWCWQHSAHIHPTQQRCNAVLDVYGVMKRAYDMGYEAHRNA